jgi:hypothetical protein
MPYIKSLVALTLSLGLAGCAGNYPASRNLSDTGPSVAAPHQGPAAEAGMKLVPADYNVTQVNVTVPRDLRVSEANVFYPVADIVWHGDPLGNRYDQVAAILKDGFAAGTVDMKGAQDVVVDVQLIRFHALTPKTRYTVGGIHYTEFLLTVRDAVTGEVLDGPRNVVAQAKASGGARALEEEAAGITQRVVIESRIAEVVRETLAQRLVPEGTVIAPVAVSDAAPVAEPVAVPAAALAAASRDAFTPADLPLVDWNGALRPVH